MPLYNNILLSRKNGSKGGEPPKSNSNASMKLLQDHLLSKRRMQQQNSPLRIQKQTDRSYHDSKSSHIISESTLHKPLENDWEPEDEYDPMMPNSYEILQIEHFKAEESKLVNRKSSSFSNKKIIPNILDVLDKLEEDDYDTDSNNKNRGTAIAPPLSLLTNSSSVDDIERINKLSTVSSSDKLDGSSVAAKIMSKMGYKVGQGLGKDEQGISTPLEVEKSGLNVGRILPAQKPTQKSISFSDEANSTKEDKPVDNIAELLRKSTRVLLLQNMVGPGEVDDDLEAETKEECKKYGDVARCLIYEIPNKKVPDDKAVRIFVEFRKVESAIKAASDLNGRYFGGRIVRASFYSLEKFNKFELGPGGDL